MEQYTQKQEQALVESAKQDENAFAQLYDQTYDRIFRYILRRCNEYELAQDLTSETYFKALKNLGKYKTQEGKPFIAWLYRIASNEVNMYFRKMKNYHFVALEDHPELAEHSSAENNPNEHVQQNELRAVLHKALQILTPLDQTIVSLRYFEQQSITEIAAVVNAQEGTIRSRLCRALKKMKPHLQQNNFFDII
ncbi:MAG TPA: sigma-70 family RNA polymerase sigma factor [Patescibacteria group bacterium]|nr:sigma-70 family RNA polymerase sigma factor [Patescibacteria group bacterium]